jgi:hypothetical protein
VLELPFSWKELGTGVAYIGVIRIREVIATVAIGGRDGRIHAEDLHGLMRLATGRVTGEEPPGEGHPGVARPSVA